MPNDHIVLDAAELERRGLEAKRRCRERLSVVLAVIGACGVLFGIAWKFVEKAAAASVEPASRPTAPSPRPSLAVPTNDAGVPQHQSLRLVQFEVDGTLSAYVSRESGAGRTYYLDPGFNPKVSSLVPDAVFNVTLENRSDGPLIVSRVVYRVTRIGATKGGGAGPVTADVRYKHSLLWREGDQVAPLVPPFRLAPHEAGSFLLELRPVEKGIGNAWLMEAIFVADADSVSTRAFEWIASNP